MAIACCTVQEAHKEADELLEKMAEIEKEMEKYQHEAEHSEHDRVSKLLHERKLLKNLEEENEQLEHTIKAAQQRVFNRVGPVVTKLAHTLQYVAFLFMLMLSCDSVLVTIIVDSFLF